MSLEQTWRWYGPKDPISLNEIKQTGATGIVSALHHIPNGKVWSVDEIQKHKKQIEDAGLSWSVVESVPVHEDIKKQKGDYKTYIQNYKQTLINLGQEGIHTVCYNFMPVLDWSRTKLNDKDTDNTLALLFNPVAFAAFELFILKRPGAETSYATEIKQKAEGYYKKLTNNEKEELINTILQGLPGSEESFSLENFQEILNEYENIDAEKLRNNLIYFLSEVIPIAEKHDVRMAIHPDDPPWPLLGLPRVVSNINDLERIINCVDSISNGITLCTGSLGAGHFNDLVKITKKFAHRINFAHLRNVSRNETGFFKETNLFEGDIDIYGVMRELILEQKKRKKIGRSDIQIPMRPDHGHLMLDDINKAKTYPGYSLIGRMKGLAELRGLEIGIERSVN
jgi:mannonate dehydratase